MVKVISDSTSDLPSEIARELGITIVPAYVHIAGRSYRDGVDISPEELYQKMVSGPVNPTTSSPAPGDFTNAYQEAARDTDEIVAITITSKQSAIYQAALTGREAFKGKARIEVVDSHSCTMGVGLIAMLAAREAKQGKSLDEVMEAVKGAIPRTHGIAMLDTIKYVARGGRLGKSGGILGALVKVKPMLEIKDGWVRLCGVTRTRSMGLEKLYRFGAEKAIDDVAVVHSDAAGEAKVLAQRLRPASPRNAPVVVARLGSAIGVHSGPQAMVITLIEAGAGAAREAEKEGKGRKFTLPTIRIPRRQ